jgi:hypothetical protein
MSLSEARKRVLSLTAAELASGPVPPSKIPPGRTVQFSGSAEYLAHIVGAHTYAWRAERRRLQSMGGKIDCVVVADVLRRSSTRLVLLRLIAADGEEPSTEAEDAPRPSPACGSSSPPSTASSAPSSRHSSPICRRPLPPPLGWAVDVCYVLLKEHYFELSRFESRTAGKRPPSSERLVDHYMNGESTEAECESYRRKLEGWRRIGFRYRWLQRKLGLGHSASAEGPHVLPSPEANPLRCSASTKAIQHVRDCGVGDLARSQGLDHITKLLWLRLSNGVLAGAEAGTGFAVPDLKAPDGPRSRNVVVQPVFLVATLRDGLGIWKGRREGIRIGRSGKMNLCMQLACEGSKILFRGLRKSRFKLTRRR